MPAPEKPNSVFNILPFAKKREHLEIARAVLEETGLPCFTAEDHRDSSDDVTDRWLRYLDDATLVIADLSTPSETCSLEAGIALGKRKPLFIVSRRSVESLPYGTHTRPTKPYRSMLQLREAVKTFCLPFRRRVMNLELIEEAGLERSGLPGWYSPPSGASLDTKLVAAALLFSVDFGVLVTIGIRLGSPKWADAGVLVGTVLAFLGLAVTVSARVQRHLEKLVAARINWYLLGLGILSPVLLAIWWLLRLPPPPPK